MNKTEDAELTQVTDNDMRKTRNMHSEGASYHWHQVWCWELRPGCGEAESKTKGNKCVKNEASKLI